MTAKNPEAVWKRVIAATRDAMKATGIRDISELRSELVAYRHNLRCTPGERIPQSEILHEASARLWDALLEMGWHHDPLAILDKVEEEFAAWPHH